LKVRLSPAPRLDCALNNAAVRSTDEVKYATDALRLGPGDVLLGVTDVATERRSGSRMLGDDGGTDGQPAS
jgi:hypothetical protein